jgi:hypothetical protein
MFRQLTHAIKQRLQNMARYIQNHHTAAPQKLKN